MSDEFKHVDEGVGLSRAEWEGTAGHVFDSQATGDVMYASSATQLSRLAKGTARQLLQMNAGGTLPEWASNIDIPGTLDVAGAATFDSALHIDDTTGSTSVTTGAFICDGGAGIAEELWVGGTAQFADNIYLADGKRIDWNAGEIYLLQTNELLLVQGSGPGANVQIVSVNPADSAPTYGVNYGLRINNANNVQGDISGGLTLGDSVILYEIDAGGGAASAFGLATGSSGGLTERLYIATGGIMTLRSGTLLSQDDTTNSTSATTGSIHTDGGIGIAENLYIAKALNTPDGMGADGEQLQSGGDNLAMDWAAAGSMREFKKLGEKLDPQKALASILTAPAWLFKYRAKTTSGRHAITTGDLETEYAGVMADQFPEVMHQHGRIFSPVSGFGYTVAALQAMQAEIDDLQAQLAAA